MRRLRLACALLVAPVVVATPAVAQPAAAVSLDRLTHYPFPSELNAAARANRMVWAFNEAGVRNLYVAEGPDFTPRRLTNYTQDDGQELTSVQLTADGRYVVYVLSLIHISEPTRPY